MHDSRKPVDHAGEHLSLEVLSEEFVRFYQGIWRDNDLAFARETGRGPVDLTVNITDLNCAVRFDLYEGRMFPADAATADVALSSEVLKMLFRSKFGRGTLTINGRAHFN